MRQFRLINGNGETFDLMRKDAFFHAPGGLGFDRDVESMMAGYEFVELRDDLAQKVISGEMVFLGYEQYKEFVSFIGSRPLRLEYKPLNQWHRIRVKVQRLGKTEISRVGRLICAIDFLAFSTWYNVINYETVPEVEPEDENLMVRGNAFYSESDSSTPPNEWTIGASTDADDVVKRFLSGNTAPSMNTVPVQLPSFTGDTYQLTAGDYYFKAIGKRQGVRSYFKVKPLVKTASGNPIQISDAVEVAPNSLEVSVSPKQDGTPWIGSETDTDPYTFRAMPAAAAGGNREYDKLIGASVVWNQLVPTAYKDYSSFTFTGETTYNYVAYQPTVDEIPIKSGHVYLASVFIERTIAGNNELQIVPWNRHSGGQVAYGGIMELANGASNGRVIGIFTANENGYIDRISFNNYSGKRKFEAGDSVAYRNLFLIDLTQMFGSTVANAMTVDLFREYFPAPYYAYDAGSIQSVSVSEKTTIGFNQWNEHWEVGAIRQDNGQTMVSAQQIRIKFDEPIPCIGGATYCFYNASARISQLYFYDADDNFILNYPNADNNPLVYTIPSNACYMRFQCPVAYGNSYKNDICINLSDPAKNGTYEAYSANTYALDDTELRGLFSIVDGELVADGDEYPSSGSGTQKYGIVDLGSLTYTAYGTGDTKFFYATIADIAPNTLNILSVAGIVTPIGSSNTDDGIYVANTDQFRIRIKSHQNDDANAFKTAMSGVYLLYELATPAALSLDPFTNPQIVDPNGTESYTDAGVAAGTRDVAIPVGHSSNYALQVPIIGTDEISTWIHGRNLWNDGDVTGTAMGYYSISLPIGIYTVSAIPTSTDTDATTNAMMFRYTDGTYSTLAQFNRNVRNARTFNLEKPVDRVYLYASDNITHAGLDTFTFADIQIETGSVEHDYEPYTGSTTYTSTISPTMYGGSVNLISGSREDTVREYDLGNLSYSYSSLNQYFYTTTPQRKYGVGIVCKCTLYDDLGDTSGAEMATVESGKMASNNNSTQIKFKNTHFTDPDEFKAAMAGIKLYVERTTPTTGTITPEAVTLLKGENIISTDGDDIDLSYEAYPDSRLVLDVYGELAPDPDSAADTQVVANFTVYADQEVQFYMDQEDIPFDFSIEAFLAAGSYPAKKIYGYPYPYSYADSINGEMDVFNGSTVAGYCRLTIHGPVEDPIWAVYQNGQLLQRGKITATIPEGHTLVVDSSPTELEISERTLDGDLVANRYADSDFSTVRFITIPPGSSKVVVTQTGDEPITAYLEVDELAPTV